MDTSNSTTFREVRWRTIVDGHGYSVWQFEVAGSMESGLRRGRNVGPLDESVDPDTFTSMIGWGSRGVLASVRSCRLPRRRVFQTMSGAPETHRPFQCPSQRMDGTTHTRGRSIRAPWTGDKLLLVSHARPDIFAPRQNRRTWLSAVDTSYLEQWASSFVVFAG